MPKFVINTHSTTESLNEILDVIHPKCYKYNSKNKTTSFEIYGTVELDYENLVCRMEIEEFESIFREALACYQSNVQDKESLITILNSIDQR